MAFNGSTMQYPKSLVKVFLFCIYSFMLGILYYCMNFSFQSLQKKHYPEHMERIYPGGDKAIKKSESSPIIQKCSEEIEAKEGRKKVRVQTEFTPGATGAKVPVKRRADQQGGPEGL